MRGAPTTETPERKLGLPELIAIGVGGMIGGGIFTVLGIAVQISGHAAPLAFLVGSIIAITAGYSYIRLALVYCDDGASFTYLERAFPKRREVAGIAGWVVVIGYVGTLALYAFTFGAYASHLFGQADNQIMRFAMSSLVLLFFMFLNLKGAGAMGRAEDYVVYVKILLLAIVGAVGFFAVDTSRFVPLVNHGVTSIFLGGAMIFVAFEGFQLITNAISETKNPEGNIPRGIYGSIIITSLIYIAIAVVAVGALDPQALLAAEEYALAVVAKPVLGRIGVVMVDIAAMLATSSAINATVFGASHLASQMATEELAPKLFSFKSRKYNAPAGGIIIISIAAILFSALGNLDLIASFSSMTFLLVSIGITVANLRLRKETKSKLLPIILGLVFMGSAVIALLTDLFINEKMNLVVFLVLYVVTAATHFLFELKQRHIRVKRR